MQIGTGKQGVLIGEYGFHRIVPPKAIDHCGVVVDGDSTDKNRVIGWMEPACTIASWIVFVTQQGDAIIHRQRDMDGDAVDDPIRLSATGKNYDKEAQAFSDLRLAVHGYLNSPNCETENKLRVLMYGEPSAKNESVVYYGPHACDKCAVLICKMGREFGTDSFDYPQGPIYPNAKWIPHVCQQADIEKVNGLRALGWGPNGNSTPPDGTTASE